MLSVRCQLRLLTQTLLYAVIATGGIMLWMTSQWYDLSNESYQICSENTYRRISLTRDQTATGSSAVEKKYNLTSLDHKNFTYSYTVMKDPRQFVTSSYFIPCDFIVNPFPYKYIIKPKNLFDTKPFLVIMVCSVHSHKNVRTAIRETWGSVARLKTWPGSDVNLNVKLLFLFGENETPSLKYHVSEENKKYNDILKGDFYDSYTNLTLKILMGLRFVAESCPDCQYVLKADEDTFTNVDLLYDFLETVHPVNSVIGHIYNGGPVHRHGKWAVTCEMYPHNKYPFYASGNTYVLSRDFIHCITNTSSYLPYVPIEDVFFTGIMSIVCKTNLINLDGITFWLQRAPFPKDLAKKMQISANKISPRLAMETWQELLQLKHEM